LKFLAITALEERERSGTADLSGWVRSTADNTGLTIQQVHDAAAKDLTGRAAEQVEAFLRDELDPALEGAEAAPPEGLRV
jgi:hypothetical protein